MTGTGRVLVAGAIAALAVAGCATEEAPQPPRRSLVFYILPVQAPVLTATLAKALIPETFTTLNR